MPNPVEIAETAGAILPEAAAAGGKLLEEFAATFGRAGGFFTRRFEACAGSIKTERVGASLLRTYGCELAFETPQASGFYAKSVELSTGGSQLLKNADGIERIKWLNNKELFPARSVDEVVSRFPRLSGQTVPDWLRGSDSWMYEQASLRFPTSISFDHTGSLTSIAFPEPVELEFGPFRNLVAKEVHVNSLGSELSVDGSVTHWRNRLSPQIHMPGNRTLIPADLLEVGWH